MHVHSCTIKLKRIMSAGETLVNKLQTTWINATIRWIIRLCLILINAELQRICHDHEKGIVATRPTICTGAYWMHPEIHIVNNGISSYKMVSISSPEMMMNVTTTSPWSWYHLIMGFYLREIIFGFIAVAGSFLAFYTKTTRAGKK